MRDPLRSLIRSSHEEPHGEVHEESTHQPSILSNHPSYIHHPLINHPSYIHHTSIIHSHKESHGEVHEESLEEPHEGSLEE